MSLSTINHLPPELFINIITFLPFKNVISLFLLSKQYNEQYTNNSLLFCELCKNLCKQNKIAIKEIENYQKKEREINYKNTLQYLIENYLNYTFNTSIPYYDQNLYHDIYSISNYNKTLTVVKEPKHGEFITICSKKEFKKGNFYKTIFKLNEYNPKRTKNFFKVMIGVESKYFFPWNNQSGNDVISWNTLSYGAAFIIGSQQLITKPNGQVPYLLSNGVGYSYEFKSGDCIVMEVDLTNLKESEINNKIENAESYCKEREIFGFVELSAKDYSAKMKFSVYNCKLKTFHVGEWIEFGNSNVTYVPSVSVNVGQTVSIYGTEYAAGISM